MASSGRSFSARAEFGDRSDAVATAGQGRAQADVRGRVVGLQPQGRAELDIGLVLPPFACQGRPQVVMDRGVAGIDPQGRTERLDGDIELAFACKGGAEVLVAVASSGWRRMPVRNSSIRGFHLPLVRQQAPQAHVRRGIVGVEAKGLPELGDSIFHLALSGQGRPEIVMGRRVVGLEPDGLAELGDGLLLRLPLARERRTEGDVELRDSSGLSFRAARNSTTAASSLPSAASPVPRQ